MVPSSRLLVIEVVVLPSLSQSRSPPPDPKNKNDSDAPWPLPKDYGFVNRYSHHQSMQILNLLNGLDRGVCCIVRAIKIGARKSTSDPEIGFYYGG
ncbi:hypothetical protein K439DRAFT_1638988 [Ramaria rubella]|nr:hypothetical protein K439DRAFT_1638988 [Ramaria rubella]